MKWNLTLWPFGCSAVAHWWHVHWDCSSVAWTGAGHRSYYSGDEKRCRKRNVKKVFFSPKPWKEVGLSLYPSSSQKETQPQQHGGKGGEEITLTKKEKAEERKDQEITTETLPERARVGSQRAVFGMWTLLKGQLEPAQELSSALGWG